MPKRRWILWAGLIAPSMERMVMTESDDGFEHAWAEVDDQTLHKVVLVRTPSGEWLVDGKVMPELADCVDVDLEWSPATNTLPIRRLALTPGKQATVTAAWIRFPSARVEPLTQAYERIDERRYRYRSESFQAVLEVDDDGLVLEYGSNWRAVASSSGS